MRGRLTIALMSAAAVLVALSFADRTPKLIWNRTQSVPEGLYSLTQPTAPLERGSLVAYLPEPREAQWLEDRGAVGRGWPLLKRVAGLEGDEVCVLDDRLLINGHPAAVLLAADSRGHTLPRPSGCQRLGPAEVLLLADHPRSLDGRYFGTQELSRVLGEARPIWQLQEPNGR